MQSANNGLTIPKGSLLSGSLAARFCVRIMALALSFLAPAKGILDALIQKIIKFRMAILFFAATTLIFTNPLNPYGRETILGDITAIPLLSIIFLALVLPAIAARMRSEQTSFILRLVLIAFVIKLGYIIAAHQVITFPDETSVYDRFAGLKAQSWITGERFDFDLDTAQASSGRPYLYFLASVYFVFGKHILIGKLFNLFLHIITGLMVYYLARRLFDEKTGVVALSVFYISAYTTLWSLALLRESMMLLAIAVVFVIIAYAPLRPRAIHWLLTLGTVYWLYKLRFYVAIIAGVPALVAALSEHVRRLFSTPERAVATMCFCLVFIVVMCVAWNTAPENLKAGVLQRNQHAIHTASFIYDAALHPSEFTARIDHIRKSLIPGKTTYLPDADISTPWKALAFLPIGAGYAFFAPFPWTARDTRMLMFSIDNLIWYVLLFFGVWGILITLRSHRSRSTLMLVAYLGVLFLFLALVEANVGMLVRHRVQAFPLMIFAAKALTHAWTPRVKLN